MILTFIAFSGLSCGAMLGDPNPSMSAAEKDRDADYKGGIFFGWLMSVTGILVLVVCMANEKKPPR